MQWAYNPAEIKKSLNDPLSTPERPLKVHLRPLKGHLWDFFISCFCLYNSEEVKSYDLEL